MRETHYITIYYCFGGNTMETAT